MGKENGVVILGGGIAGLSTAYFLMQRDIRPTVYEALGVPGGNCRTIQVDGFRFDSGAHRIHGKDPEITGHIFKVMGNQIKRVQAPSRIFDEGRLLSFPLEPWDVFRKMDACFTLKACFDLMISRLGGKKAGDFEHFAVHSYGRTMARRYLLNYSRKLWGLPCSDMSPDISGERLKRMNLGTLLLGILSKKSASRLHYEGEFYYPEQGIGRLSESIATCIGNGNIRLNSRVTGILHENNRIKGVEINSHEQVAPSHVVTTLPVTDFIAMMKPAPPPEVLNAARMLRFRNIRLAVFFLRSERVNDAATMYFPADAFMFTRGYEPKNRCVSMAPGKTTSFVTEVPCFDGDWAWRAERSDFLARVGKQIVATGLVGAGEIAGGTDERIVNAYPVLERDHRDRLSVIAGYLSRFENLEVSGRNGLFRYMWIHNLIKEGRNVSERIAGKL